MQNVSNHQIMDDPEYISFLNKRKMETEIESQKAMYSTQRVISETQYMLFNSLVNHNKVTTNDLKNIVSNGIVNRNLNFSINDVINFRNDTSSMALKVYLQNFILEHKNAQSITHESILKLFQNEQFKEYFQQNGFAKMIEDFKINGKIIKLKAIDLDSIIEKNTSISEDLLIRLKMIRKNYGSSLNEIIKSKHLKDLINNKEFINLIAKQKLPMYINFFNNKVMSDSLKIKLNKIINSKKGFSKTVSLHQLKSLMLDNEFRNLLSTDMQENLLKKLESSSKKISFKIGDYVRKTKISKWWQKSRFKKGFDYFGNLTNRTLLFIPNQILKMYLKTKKSLSFVFKPIFKPFKLINNTLRLPFKILFLPIKLPLKALKWVSNKLVFSPLNWVLRRIARGSATLINGIYKIGRSIVSLPFKLTYKFLKYIMSKLAKTRMAKLIGASSSAIGSYLKTFSKRAYSSMSDKVRTWFSGSKLKQFLGKATKSINIFSLMMGKMFGWLLSLFTSLFSGVITVVAIILVLVGVIWFLGYEDIRVPSTNFKNDYTANAKLDQNSKDELNEMISSYKQDYGISITSSEIENINYAIYDIELLIEDQLTEDQSSKFKYILDLFVITSYDDEDNPVYNQRDKQEVVELIYKDLKEIDQTKLLSEYESDFKTNFYNLANKGG